MAEEVKKPAEPVKKIDASDYAAIMKKNQGITDAVQWQKRDEKKLADAVAKDAIAAYLKDEASSAALLAKIRPAYTTDPVILATIGAVSQFVMNPANGHVNDCGKLCKNPQKGVCRRKVWNLALIAAFRKTKDAYIQTFLLDQFRWCGCKAQKDELKKLKADAVNDEVRKYIDWVYTEVTGEFGALK